MLNKTLLGSAAVIMAVAGAQAADLPSKKAAPATYVKICDAYGAGFYTIPGTDTCIKVGGYLRAEYAYAPSANAVLPIAAPVAATAVNSTGGSTSTWNKFYFTAPTQVSGNGQDTTGMHERGVLQLDARTPSSFGTARTYIAVRTVNQQGLYNNTALTGNFGAGTQATSVTLDRAFVQFAGFTFGRADETFSFMPAPNFISYAWSSYPSGIGLVSYTAVIGGGVSATVALQDRTQNSQSTGVGSLYTAPTADANALTGTLASATQANSGMLVSVVNGPTRLPELAGNVRMDQAWGSAQVMGSVVQNSALVTGASVYAAPSTTTTPIMAVQSYNNQYLTTGGNTGSAINKTGWAIGAGVKFNLPMITAGDTLYLTAAYTDGDLDHLGSSSTSDRSANIGREFTGLIRSDRNLYVVPTSWNSANGVAQLTGVKAVSPKGWSVGGIFTHNWTPTFRSVVASSFLQINTPADVKAVDTVFGGLSNVSVTQVGHEFVWSPIKDLNFGLETAYARLSQSATGQNGNAPFSAYTAPAVVSAGATVGAASTTVAAIPVKLSPNLYAVRVRIDRQF